MGGRGSILGPLIGNVLLTLLPEFAAPLVAWSTFLYAVLLLAIVLLMPGGIAALLDFRDRKPLESNRRSSSRHRTAYVHCWIMVRRARHRLAQRGAGVWWRAGDRRVGPDHRGAGRCMG